MVYGAIDEKDEKGYTKIGKVFEAINNKQVRYNWLITDIYYVPRKIEEYCSDKGYCWLTGEKLSQIVREDDSSGLGPFYLVLRKGLLCQKF